MEFTAKEDVEALLAEKMKGKSKTDFKGKSEQMSEYIKKLRACICWYKELEDGYIAEQEKLRGMMDVQNTQHAEIETRLSSDIEELKAANQELRGRCELLEASFRKEEANKMAALESYEKEKELRVAVEASRDQLTVDLESTTHKAKRLADQLRMMQDTNRRLQEYNTSLQQYNSNLQVVASKNVEAIWKLQNEKNTIMETMANLLDHANSVKNQLDSLRTSLQETIREKEELRKEFEFLRSELLQVREDRDHA